MSLGLPVGVLVIRTWESSKPSTGDVTSGPSGVRRRKHERMLNGSNGSVWPGRRATGPIGRRGDRGPEALWRSKLGSIKGPLQAPGSRFCRLRTRTHGYRAQWSADRVGEERARARTVGQRPFEDGGAAVYGGVVNWGLATVGLALLLVAAVSRRLSNTPITPAMVVVAIGVLAGPLVFDGLTVGPTSSTVRRLAEATLAVVLFSDSSRIDLQGRFGGKPPCPCACSASACR